MNTIQGLINDKKEAEIDIMEVLKKFMNKYPDVDINFETGTDILFTDKGRVRIPLIKINVIL